jgi:hypothetical protein
MDDGIARARARDGMGSDRRGIGMRWILVGSVAMVVAVVAARKVKRDFDEFCERAWRDGGLQ